MADRTEAEIRNAALEEAARACDRQERLRDRKDAQAVCRLCARDIRALKSAPAAQAPAKGADVADELADLASDMAYEANQEMDQEKASRAAIIERGERALRQLADRQQRGGDVAAVLRQFLTGDGFIAECDIPHIVHALTARKGESNE